MHDVQNNWGRSPVWAKRKQLFCSQAEPAGWFGGAEPLQGQGLGPVWAKPRSTGRSPALNATLHKKHHIWRSPAKPGGGKCGAACERSERHIKGRRMSSFTAKWRTFGPKKRADNLAIFILKRLENSKLSGLFLEGSIGGRTFRKNKKRSKFMEDISNNLKNIFLNKRIFLSRLNLSTQVLVDIL